MKLKKKNTNVVKFTTINTFIFQMMIKRLKILLYESFSKSGANYNHWSVCLSCSKKPWTKFS